MAYFQFIATRSLASGYSAGDTVDLAVKCQSVDADFQPVKEVHTTLSGKRFHRVIRNETTYDIEAGPIVGQDSIALMQMFIHSISDGSIFAGDLDNDVGLSFTNYQIEGKLSPPKKLSSEIYVYRFTLVQV